jgi:hypothetical protein
MKTKHIVFCLVCGGLAIFAFQNCGATRFSDSSAGPSQSRPSNDGGEQVVGPTAKYNKIIFTSARDLPAFPTTLSGTRVAIDLTLGTLQIRNYDAQNPDIGRGEYTCEVDAIRLETMRAIIASSQICHAEPLPANSYTCMAFNPPDIELSSNAETVRLSELMCYTGTFLCDGADAIFRTLLADLRDHPPVGCD